MTFSNNSLTIENISIEDIYYKEPNLSRWVRENTSETRIDPNFDTKWAWINLVLNFCQLKSKHDSNLM